MICRRCGKNNSDNDRYCNGCGAPLTMTGRSNNQKKSEGVIIALIIILVLLLGIVVGVLMNRNNNSNSVGTGSSESYGASTSQTASTNDTSSNATDYNDAVEKQPVATIPAEKPNVTNERLLKKDEFLRVADDIEWYDEMYLETAGPQMEINRESGIVYEKWDNLLNEVYQYLKTIMPASQFSKLQEDEKNWVAIKENAIEEAGAEWAGGSGEPMARNCAGIQHTKERCYYLISLIK